MRKTVLYIATSLDGCIADKKGTVSWLQGDGTAPDQLGSYPAFIQTVDTVLLGWNTYHQIVTELSPDSWPYEGQTSYIITHRAEQSTDNRIFTKEDPILLAKRLKESTGKDIWICGGAGLAQQFIRADAVDLLYLSVIPAILGEGIRLFPQDKSRSLKLVKTESYNGIVDLVYTFKDR